MSHCRLSLSDLSQREIVPKEIVLINHHDERVAGATLPPAALRDMSVQ